MAHKPEPQSNSASTSVGIFVQARDIAKAEIPESATTVLLGECTHGTEEFYQIRADLTKYLIEARGFRVVLCEADWPFLWHANQYIHRKRKTIFPCEEDGSERVRFPDWMWRNRPFVELIEWMRKRASNDGPYLFGMDCYCKDESKEEVMKFLDRHDKDGLGKAFRRTCYPQDKPDRWPDILAKLQWEIESEDMSRRTSSVLPATKKFRGCTKLDQFNCEQNLECMIAAHEYYSKQQLEPPGSRASWNARDQHMMTTLLRLKEHSKELFDVEDVKVAVWAHNSHVGDASSTPMGGAEFTRNEKWNLGQMCRSTLQNVFIVGFYSYAGTVRAAERWGGEGRIMQLNEAVPNSLEHHLHEWFPNCRGWLAVRKLMSSFKDRVEFAYAPSAMPLNVEYCAVHPNLYFTRERDTQEKATLGDRIAHEEADSEDLRMMQVRSIKVEPTEPFVAVKREAIGRSGTVRLLTDKGLWVTEYTPHGSRTIHCLPKNHFDNLRGSRDTLTNEKLVKLATFPILQRWVGVQYHPETEIESHYGEMAVSKCYDLVVFCDKTKALDVDVSVCENSGADEIPTTTAVAGTGQTNKRLLIEYRRIMKNPIENIEARPLDTNILEWHFLLTGCQDPYTGGKYHGILEFPDDFPMKPPSIKLLTPSGRFEINKRICLSMSDFHSESWNPSWTVEKILIGLMSFMYEESTASVGSILESYSSRKRYAAESEYFNVQNDIYCELFCSEMAEEELRQKQKSRKLFAVGGTEAEELDENERACRFCLMETGELVSPCACKGSGQFVHFACLRQWQKSVMLTQSTHPKYQTQIDAVCNICETPFKEAYKPISRRTQIMQYIQDSDDGKSSLADMVRVGNLIVSSRPKSEKNIELMERRVEDSLNMKLGHFTQAVYLITTYDKHGRRGGGSVLAVNIEQRRKLPNNLPLSVAEDKMPGSIGSLVSPLRVWQQRFVPMLNKLFGVGAAGDFDACSIEHFSGGPVEPAHPFGIVEMTKSEAVLAKSSRIDVLSILRRMRVKNDIFFGDLETLLALVADYSNLVAAAVEEKDARKASVKVFWGYASWDGTQLLGEIARCGWGLLVSDDELGMLNGTWDVCSAWERIVDTTKMARESEYSLR